MIALVTVLLYLSALLTVGWRKSRSVGGSTDFLLAGRRLGTLVLVGTLVATWTGTGSIFGNAEEAWRVGLPSLVLPVASVLGIFALVVMAPRVRRADRVTLQDVLEERYGPAARVLGTLTLVSAYLVIVSYQLRAANAVFDGVLDGLVREGSGAAAAVADGFARTGARLDEALRGVGIPSEHGGNTAGLLLLAVLIAVYTALAGLMSVAVTDTFNGVLMLVGVGCALPLVWFAAGEAAQAAGGADAGLVARVVAELPESGRRLGGHYSGLEIASVLLPAFLLVMGDANLHQRFLSAGSVRAARTAAFLFIPAVLLVDAVILLTAIAGRVVMPDLDDPGHVILRLALDPDVLPPLLGGLLTASILAVIVSTADSYLLSSSASLVRDVYHRFVSRDADERTLLRVARCVVVALTGVAFVMALQSSAFFEVSLFAYTLYGVGITPALVAALFWRRVTPVGALASMVAGPAAAIIWRARGLADVLAEATGDAELGSVGAVVPAILVATLVLVGVSLATRPRAPSTSG